MILTIFYDSHCPLCSTEMQHLKKYDRQQRIRLIDLHDDSLLQAYPHIDKDKAIQKLHGQQENGDMLYGLDVTVMAWNLVGKYRFLKILRWPVIRHIADIVYTFFARHRQTISLLLTGRRHCQQCKVNYKQN